MLNKKKNVGVLISGRGSNLFSLLRSSMDPHSMFKIACVVANCDASGLQYAKDFSVPWFVFHQKNFPDKISFEEKISDIFVFHQINLVCLAGFMRILSPLFVEKWKNRLINIHPSILPSFKGLEAQRQALESGVKVTGCTVHFVDAEVDAGAIILQAFVPILEHDSVETLSHRILIAEHECYPASVRMLCSGLYGQ